MASRAANALILISIAISAAALPATAQGFLTLEQAQSRTGRDFTATYEAKTVRVRGQVSASPIWALGTYYLPIRDNADRGLILSGDLQIFTDLAPGDVIDAEGRIESRGGLPLLIPLSIKKISSDPAPRQQELTLSELSGLRNLGLMVRTTATVERTGENTGGQILIVADRGYTFMVFLPRPASDVSEHLASGLFKAREGDRVRILALVTQYAPGPPYNRDFQLMLASPEDVEILATAALLPPFLVLGVVAGLGLLGLLWWLRERRLKAQRESWQASYGLSEDLIAAATPAEMAEKLATILPSVIDATSASLYIFDRRTQSMHRVPTSVEPEPMVVPLDDPPEGMAGAAVACFRNRTLLSVPDARRNPLVKVGAKINLPRSAMFVPLLSQNEILGVLEAANARSLGFFSSDEQASTQHLANQAAASLKLQEQRAMREQIFRSEKLAATGQLISGVASELRAPLESIAKLADSLSGLEDRPLSNSDLSGLYAESRRAAEIVSRLVSFAAPGSEETESVDLNAVLGGLIRFREPEWKGLGIRLQNRLAQAPAIVNGSRGQLEQLFLNLLIHAEQRAATAATKTLSVQSSLMSGLVHVEIGYSLGPGELGGESNPFDPGPGPDGAALGLGVCLGIAKTYGGDIRFQSRGATALFDVSLPLSDGAGKVSTEFETLRPSRALTVMIVDTDPVSQRQLLRMLGAKGHRAVPVNPQESSELVERLHFDAVFWAIRADGASWSDSHDRIRNKVSAFILLSDGYDPDLARSLERGGGFLLPRPVQDAELQRVLREVQMRTGVQPR
jgi:C4-dicarboxylate-specific signal transduction histidine kinase/CheY-like chemotaxis protein